MSTRTAEHTAPTAALLTARGVRRSFPTGSGELEILHGVDVDVTAGETLAVMGPSGSGKSTLLAVLAGLERASAGSVHLLGKDLARQSRGALARSRRTSVGFVFQSYNVMPALTATENIALPFRLRGERPPAERIAQVLDALRITHLAQARPASMSGGEQQRVAIARVLVQDPQVLFADEPTGALDSASADRVLELLVSRARAADGTHPGSALVMVTHDAAVAARCDRVLILRDGVVVDHLLAPSVDQVNRALEEPAADAVRPGPVGAEGLEPGAVRAEGLQPGSVRAGSVRAGSARTGSARTGSVRTGSVRTEAGRVTA